MSPLQILKEFFGYLAIAQCPSELIPDNPGADFSGTKKAG